MNQIISSRAHQKRLAPRLLCVMIGAALGTLSASSWAAAATDSTAENAKKTSAIAATAKTEDNKTNDTITVVGAQETFRAGGNDLIPTF